MQTHLDACFKIKHLASAGRRSNEEELDEQVPARIIMKDAERDRRDAAIASKVTVTNDSSKVCNEFKADCADSGCDAVADRRCCACVHYDDLHLMSFERADLDRLTSSPSCPCRKGASKLDITALVMQVCDHRIAHRGLFCTKGENHRLGIILLEDLAEKRVVPAGELYDIGCKVKAAIKRWASQLTHVPDDVIAALLQMMVIVPPFHASMHNAECRAQNSLACERFPGWMKPMGEPAEQLWAALGPGPRLKYFTKHHLKLYLEVDLAFHNQLCDARLADELVKRINDATRLQSALQAEVAVFSECSLPAASAPQVGHNALFLTC